VRSVRLVRYQPEQAGYALAITAVAALAERLSLDAPVMFLVGENGSGKSTLVEALAVAAGFNPEDPQRFLRHLLAD
jgi:predicted ATPase